MTSTPPPDSEENIFAHALALPAADRGAYLDQACAGDAALRARIEELLQADESAGFMAAPAAGLDATVASVAPRSDEKSGDRIGRYKLLQKIGEGGCGVVYMAEQQEPVVRRVALKVIKLGMDTKEVIARFEAERQALALMDHPNIARVFDGGATDSGRPFFVMELVRGVPLTKYCDEQNLSTAARLELFTSVCHAVQHAHQKGIIHRDLKPSNILVTVNDGVPVPKVIDFGIAKATQGKLTDSTLFTAFEQFIGTPAYMSPEQAVMTSLDVDTRSDIYSLGVLLYELLTGRTPFDTKSLVAAGLDEIRRVIREVDPPRPSTRLSTLTDLDRATIAKQHGTVPAQLSTLLRGDLDWIVMKALEKDRTRRYDTPSALAADIARHLTNEPVQARPPSTGYRLGKTIRRNKLAFAAATALGVTMIVGAVVSTWQAVRALRAEHIARNEAAISEAVNRFLNDDLLSQAGGWTQADAGFSPKPNLTVKEALDRATKRLDGKFPNAPLVEAAIRHTIGRGYYELGEHDASVEQLDRAFLLRKRILGADDHRTLISMSALAWSCLNAARGEADGLMARSVTLGEEVVHRQRALLGSDHRDTLTSMHNLAWGYRHTGRRRDEFALKEETAKRSNAALGPDDPVTLRNMRSYVVSHPARGEALTVGDDTLRRMRRVLGPDHPFTLVHARTMAVIYNANNRRAEALSLLEDTLQRSRSTFGPDYEDTLTTLRMMAAHYEEDGKASEAIPLFEEVIRQAKMKDHWNAQGARWGLAKAYQEVNDFTNAERVWREALAIYERVDGAQSLHAADVKILLGAALMNQNKYAEAEPLLVAGYESMRQREATIAATAKVRLKQAIERLIQFYHENDQPEKTAEWQKKLDEFNTVPSPTAAQKP